MPISSNSWATAKAMFEGGASLAEIAQSTEIDRSTVSKKAKKLKWEKGVNQQLILDDIRVAGEKATLNQQQSAYHDFQVNFKTKMIAAYETFAEAAVMKGADLVCRSENGSDFKAVVDGMDKLSVTVGMNNRHAPPIQVQQNTQQVTEVVFTRAKRES